VIRHQPPSEAVSLTARYDTPTKINHLSPRRAAYDFINAYSCDSGLAPNRTDGTRAQADSDEAFNICQTLLIDKAAKLNFEQRAQDSKNQATGAAGLAAVTAVSSLIAVAAVAAERQRGRPRRTADR